MFTLTEPLTIHNDTDFAEFAASGFRKGMARLRRIHSHRCHAQSSRVMKATIAEFACRFLKGMPRLCRLLLHRCPDQSRASQAMKDTIRALFERQQRLTQRLLRQHATAAAQIQPRNANNAAPQAHQEGQSQLLASQNGAVATPTQCRDATIIAPQENQARLSQLPRRQNGNIAAPDKPQNAPVTAPKQPKQRHFRLPRIQIDTNDIIPAFSPVPSTPDADLSTPSTPRKRYPRLNENQDTSAGDRGWSLHEKECMKELMVHIVYVEKDETEGKWVKTRDRLRQNWAIFKTITMCRNYWFRYGRQATGIDERKKKKPDRMVTGIMDPEKRKRKRQEAKKLQEEKKRKLDADMDDEEGQTQLPKPKKRHEAEALRTA
ncbi:hypothetical protein ABVK25_008381 [Lepraria finkii]|uniref:Myb-like domain-containing protein n=1 Tax=Lepraria finkii TaxID=1340010 RepID=A0ABR4B0B6_9LECA